MDLLSLYDETDPLSIAEYSEKLIGKTFNQVLQDFFREEFELYLEARKKFNPQIFSL